MARSSPSGRTRYVAPRKAAPPLAQQPPQDPLGPPRGRRGARPQAPRPRRTAPLRQLKVTVASDWQVARRVVVAVADAALEQPSQALPAFDDETIAARAT